MAVVNIIKEEIGGDREEIMAMEIEAILIKIEMVKEEADFEVEVVEIIKIEMIDKAKMVIDKTEETLEKKITMAKEFRTAKDQGEIIKKINTIITQIIKILKANQIMDQLSISSLSFRKNLNQEEENVGQRLAFM